MKILGQVFCLFLLSLTFSCDPDSSFDNENPEAKIEGTWEVMSVESKSYSSTITSPNGQSDTSEGSFIGSDINMDIVFNIDNTFTTSGDYNQVLTVLGSLPQPIMFETRYDDFEGGGIWEISNNVLSVRTNADAAFQTASLNVFTDTEMEFDYTYIRTVIEGTVEREIEVEVSYVLEKK